MIDLAKLTSIAKDASLDAGKAILAIYQNGDIGLEIKEDQSPLTLADKAAHEVIMKHLAATGLPVLSEEGRAIPFAERKTWEYFWMVDPLDGTKEFVKRNGEFTVNIALINRNTPVMGVIYAPVLDWLYWGSADGGAWKQIGNNPPTRLKPLQDQEVRTIVASRSHLNPETKEIIDSYPGAETISMGSSLKFMLLGENKAQLYPRLAPTMEWDTAAAHGILLGVNGQVYQISGNTPIIYNKENLLNPSFVAGLFVG
ncbi:MAG TPA: 3'(2'),5'-bisphosphate nucleotidase CysQ [Lunatimonas sp.]|nr:3'(2'),5'-bisphosphate nucleotidase CysQ [Lunatimonas sp.]